MAKRNRTPKGSTGTSTRLKRVPKAFRTGPWHTLTRRPDGTLAGKVEEERKPWQLPKDFGRRHPDR